MNTELLLKYIEGNSTDQEKIAVANWLDSDAENMREYLALRKLHDIAIWHQSPEAGSVQNFSKKVWAWRPIYTEVLKIAAVLLVAVFISRFLFPETKTVNPVALQTLHVPAGQRAEITLEDGTKVWLNAKTTMTFPNQFSGKTREVQLNGEGYFDVTPNKAQPFIVKTEKYDIKVWGTKFNLMAYSEKGIFEASLLEGSIEVLNSGTSHGVFIRPDERIYLADNNLVKSPIVNMNHFLWKDGIISFNDESFTELVSKLELYFDLKIEVKNEKILNYRCTGKFRTKDGVEHILKVLQLRNKFSFSIDDKLNLITIK